MQAFLSKYGNDLLIHIAFAVWAVLAIFFFQERIYSDTGFYIAKVVHYESFWVDLQRYILIFSEWLPLLCIKLGLGMKAVLVSYSIGHVLFFYACYWVARYRYQHQSAGWYFLLVQTVGISYGFCAPGFEFYYVAGFLGLWTILFYEPITTKNVLLQFVLLFFILTGYELAVLYLAAIGLGHLWQYQLKHWKYYLAIALFGLACLTFKRMYATSYEQEKVKWFLHTLQNHHFDQNYWSQLLGFYWQYYKELWLLVFLNIGIGFYKKKYAFVAFYIIYIAINQYLVSANYTNIKHGRYQEQCYFPMIIIATLPLVFYTITLLQQKYQQALCIFLFGIVIYRFASIPTGIQPYKDRVAMMQALIAACQERPGYKFIIKNDPNPAIADMTFAFNMEVMLLSALNPQQKTIHIIRDGEWNWREGKISAILQDTSKYLFTFKSFYDRTDSIYTHDAVNTQFFNFPNGKYRFLNGAVARTTNKKSLQEQLQLEIAEESTYIANQEYNIAIQLDNKSQQAINSKQIQLAYHWLKDGKSVVWDGWRTPIEIDILPGQKYRQKIRIKTPKKTGKYSLVIDMVEDNNPDGIGWIGLQNSKTIIVQ